MIHLKLFCNNLGGDLEIFPGLFQGKCLFHSLPGFIETEECVNHVTKRMGTNLHALVRENKGKKLRQNALQ